MIYAVIWRFYATGAGDTVDTGDGSVRHKLGGTVLLCHSSRHGAHVDTAEPSPLCPP